MATRKRRIDWFILDEITDLAITTDWTPAQIHRSIADSVSFSNCQPHIRTVERVVNDVRTTREDEDTTPWTLADSDGDEARLVLEVRWLLMDVKRAPTRRFNKGEARWLVKVLKAAPDLPGDMAWLLAGLYRSHVARDEGTEALDEYLGFAPWRDKFHYMLYIEAVKLGQIPPTPVWRTLVERYASRFDELGPAPVRDYRLLKMQ